MIVLQPCCGLQGKLFEVQKLPSCCVLTQISTNRQRLNLAGGPRVWEIRLRNVRSSKWNIFCPVWSLRELKIFLPTCLCKANGAFITNTWICTVYAWLLLFRVYIPESCDLSFKPSPAFVSWCFVRLSQFSTFRALMYSAEIWVKPSRTAIYRFVLVCSIIVLCVFVLLYERQNSLFTFWQGI